MNSSWDRTGADQQGWPLFDLRQLFASVDAERQRQRLSWSALSRQVGVSTSTIRRWTDAADAEADGVLSLVRWIGSAPEHYVSGGEGPGQTLPDGGIVRVDMELVAAATNETAGAGGRTRTTIQRLVAAAQQSGQPVAALTRISDV